MGFLGTSLFTMLGLGGPIALALIATTVGFIVYDTHMIMKHFGVDDYVRAPVSIQGLASGLPSHAT